MPGSLSDQQVEQYRRDGFVHPLRAAEAAQAGQWLAQLEAIERDEGGRLSGATNQKPYLLFPWLADIVRHPAILDPVESLLGPDILCWAGGFFAKDPGDGKRITWHQDATYWGLSEPDVATAWVAFTPSTRQSGCMRVMPGTQDLDQLPHRDTFAADNLLSRGQEIAVTVDEAQAVDIELQPGEFSLHHVRLVHGSEPNRADHRRVGLAIRYIPTRLRQVAGAEDSATLVRGEDRFHYFELEPRPMQELAPEFLALHKKIAERNARILYRGTNVSSYNDPAAIRG